MEDNKNNNSNTFGESAKSTPILSKRGQYNPNLNQDQASTQGETTSGGTYQTQSYQAVPEFQSQQPSATHGYNQPISGQPPYGQPPLSKLKHSGVGIASFIIAILAIVSSILSLVLIISGVAGAITNSGIDLNTLSDPEAVNNLLLGDELSAGMTSLIIGSLLIFFSIGIAFVGTILGLISVFQKNRKKVFGILGLIFNALIFVGFIFFLLLGLVSGV